METTPEETPQYASQAQLRVAQALMSDDEDQNRIATIGLEWLALLLQKNADYGSSAWKPPVLTPEMSPGDAILVRMSDKVQRLASLSSKAPEVAESFDDTIRDLGAYCLLYLARPDVQTEGN